MLILPAQQAPDGQVELLAVLLGLDVNLLAELARRGEDEADRAFVLLELSLVQNVDQHWPHVGQGLAAAGFGDAHYVAPRKGGWEGLRLDWGRLLKLISADQID